MKKEKINEKDQKNFCVFCGGNVGKWGNNPEPLVDFDKGRACSDCNMSVVLPARLKEVYGRMAEGDN